MSKKEINKVISVGSICFSSQFIKDNNLKKESYPFDWIFSNIDMCIDCINDDFNLFLEKKNHYQIQTRRPIRSGHLIYDKVVGVNIFAHHNIVTNHEYFYRCVDRFKKLYNDPSFKLFIYFNQFQETKISNENLQKLKLLNDILKLKIKNFYFLYINSNKHFGIQKYNIDNIDNILILNLWTISSSDGRRFINDLDNKFLKNIIYE